MVNVGVHDNISPLKGATATALCPLSAVVAVAHTYGVAVAHTYGMAVVHTCVVAVAHTYVVAVAHTCGVLCSHFNLSKKIF